MELGLIVSLIFVIICPFAYAFVNIFDKYIVSYRVKKPLGIAALSFIPLIIFGIIFFAVSDWSNVSFQKVLIPLLCGLLAGTQYFFYFKAMQMEDASSLEGMVYLYPVIVAILSFFILGERLNLLTYLGFFIVVYGVLKISLRTSASKSFKGFTIIFFLILLTAFYEFFVKITTINLPITNGMAINLLSAGLTIFIFFLFSKKIRADFFFELKNIKWVFATELITLFALSTLYLSLWYLPATIAAAIASIQPMVVLFYERIALKNKFNLTKDNHLRKKLIPMILIILGVILLYVQEIFK